jgi:hypothetical protein
MTEYFYRSLDSIGLLIVLASIFSPVFQYYITQGLLLSTLKIEAETSSETVVLCTKLSGVTCQNILNFTALL